MKWPTTFHDLALLCLFYLLQPNIDFSLPVAVGNTAPLQSADITGLWQDEDGADYHVRQTGTRVYMLIERLPDQLRSFYGTVEGDIVRGSWADLPGSKLTGSGFVSFRIDAPGRLVVIAASGDAFYGTTLSIRAGGMDGRAGVAPGVAGAGDVGAGTTADTRAGNGITGPWIWSNGAPVTVYANGGVDAGSVQGTWTGTGTSYTFRWNNGFTDMMTLSADGRSMSGRNNNKSVVSARRPTDYQPQGGSSGIGANAGTAGRSKGGATAGSAAPGATNNIPGAGAGASAARQPGAEALVGEWTWGNGAGVVINADGTMRADNLRGTWSGAGSTYTFRWDNGFTDTMTLQPDGRNMKGKNNNGSNVYASRKGASSAGGVAAGASGTRDAAVGGRLAGAEALVGMWVWNKVTKVTISADGRLDAGGLQGTWRLADAAKQVYVFEWDNGYTDTMTLWDKNNKLNGVNDRGSKVLAIRAGFDSDTVYAGGEEIAGTWNWHNKERVVITADRRLDAGRVKGRWSLIDPGSRLYELKWDNGYTDRMTLSAGSNRLDGKSSGGGTVWGTRLSQGDMRKPWETPEGRACFEDYIREVERRINAYDGGPEHNGRKPWYVNQWGLLNSRTAYGATSDRAPDDFGKHDNRYHYMWHAWHRSGPFWGKPYLDESGVPDIWEYMNECLQRMGGGAP